MAKTEITLLIRQLDREHGYDRDGGYGLVDEILKLRNRLNNEDQKTLDEALIDLVTKKDRSLWGVALEALTQAGSPDAPPKLEKLLRSLRSLWKTKEYKYQLIHSLMRLGYNNALDIYLKFIKSNLPYDKSVAILLANLHRVDRDLAIKLSSQFFGKYLPSGSNDSELEHYIPAFVHIFSEREGSLVQLVYQTGAISSKAGKKLSLMLIDYLSKPWMIKNWGQKKVEAMRSALTSTAESL